MTVLTTQVSSLARPRLPRWAPALVGAGSVAFAVLVGLLLGWGPVAIVVVAVLLFVALVPAWALVVENKRSATDRTSPRSPATTSAPTCSGCR